MLPKIVYSYWHQGRDEAPALVRTCMERMEALNSDWEIRILDEQSVEIGRRLGFRLWRFGFRGIGVFRLILVGLTRIGLVVGHAKPRRSCFNWE